MRDFYKAVKETSKKQKKLKPNEVGCYNCIRSRKVDSGCDSCIAFSNFKSVEMINKGLKEKGLDYLCTSSIEEFRRQERLEDDVFEFDRLFSNNE